MPADPVSLLRAHGPLSAGRLSELMKASRPTLSRAVKAAGNAIVRRGRGRATHYAARRALRGSLDALPLYRIDADGRLHHVDNLHLVHLDGTVLDTPDRLGWPLDDAMKDGWFEGLPYPIQDMRPQGFLGRHFARNHANLLQVSEDPATWPDDDALHALSILGDDAPGDLLFGAAACRLWLDKAQRLASGHSTSFVTGAEVSKAYPELAVQALAHGVAGSSAGGEFPKFTTVCRRAGGVLQHVLVKFAGSDKSSGTRRWSDLLVCEHLAGIAFEAHAGIACVRSAIHEHAGRTFLEVDRYDRHGALGRSATASWASLNHAFVGAAGRPWPDAAAALQQRGWLPATQIERIRRVWFFGQLIGNTDMHDGNLSFQPTQDAKGHGLQIAPVYDMLPMMYAPVRGVELAERAYAPPLPLPADAAAWHDAATAAVAFWKLAAEDARISPAFRRICSANAKTLARLAAL